MCVCMCVCVVGACVSPVVLSSTRRGPEFWCVSQSREGGKFNVGISNNNEHAAGGARALDWHLTGTQARWIVGWRLLPGRFVLGSATNTVGNPPNST